MKTKKTFILLCILTFLISISSISIGPARSAGTEGVEGANSVGLWHMNNDWTDATTNSYNGTPSGGATFDDQSRLGSHAGYFDGTDDYVTIGDYDDFSINTTGELSVSFWLKTGTDITTLENIIMKGAQGPGNPIEWSLGIVNEDFHVGFSDQTGNWIRQESIPISVNSWYHIVVVFNGYTDTDEIDIYSNKIESSSLVASNGTFTYSNTTGPLVFGVANFYGTPSPYSGSLDEVHIYNKALNASEVSTIYHSESALATARIDADTIFLLQSDSTDGNTEFIDVSDGHVIAEHGDVHHESDAAKYGDTSIQFDGTGDILAMPDSSDWALGSNDWTLDYWLNSTTPAVGSSIYQIVQSSCNSTSCYGLYSIITTSGTVGVGFASGGSVYSAVSSTVITDGDWHHVAGVRDGTNMKIYIDGTLETTTPAGAAAVNDSDGSLFIGSVNSVAPSPYYTGYLDEIRLSNTALWTSNFTPPQFPFGIVGANDQAGIEVNIADVIALDCGADVDFGTVTPGTPVTAVTVCTATTNAENGYTLQVKREDADTTMDHTTDDTANITDKSAWTSGSPNATTAIDDVLGFGVYASTATKNTTWWGTGTACDDASNNYAGFPSSYDTIMTHSTYSAIGTTTSVCYKVDLPSSQKSGSYDGVVVYQVYTNP